MEVDATSMACGMARIRAHVSAIRGGLLTCLPVFAQLPALGRLKIGRRLTTCPT